MKYVAIILMTVLMSISTSGCELEETVNKLKEALSGLEDYIPSEEVVENESHFAGTIGSNQDFAGDVIIKEFGTTEDGIVSVIIGGDETEEPENEDTAPEGDVTVEDALNYEKDITGYTYNQNGQLVLDTVNAGAYGKHKIRIPKLVGDGAEISAINDKLYEVGESKYNTLLNDNEGVNTYNIDYFSSADSKAVAIIQEINEGEQMVGGYAYYKTLYYDCQKQVEISFDDYIAVMGFTNDTLISKLKTIEDKYNNLSNENLKNIKGIVLGKDYTYVLIDFPDAVDAEPASGLFMFNTGIIE